LLREGQVVVVAAAGGAGWRRMGQVRFFEAMGTGKAYHTGAQISLDVLFRDQPLE